MRKKMIPLAQPWFSAQEPAEAGKVVKSKWLISGPIVEKFEKEFAKKIKVKYAVAVNSGSTALLMAQQALGISSGDEVIVPDITFVSTASSSLYLGARPIFADIELSTYCMNPRDIEKRITAKTKAIIPVHYAGQSADMNPIMAIARKHKLKVVEDAAEAHLAKYRGRMVGGIGDIGIFSFTPSKPMTTGEGGMITTNNFELAKKCKLMRNFCDVGKFEWAELGFNFRLPEMMGAIGLVQLKKLEQAIRIRRKIAQNYNKGLGRLAGIIIPYEREKGAMNFQLYTIRLDQNRINIGRDAFIAELSKAGIQARLYYPCLHKQKLFTKIKKYKDDGFPNAVVFAETALSLPIYPDLSNSEQKYIISAIKKITAKYKNKLYA